MNKFDTTDTKPVISTSGNNRSSDKRTENLNGYTVRYIAFQALQKFQKSEILISQSLGTLAKDLDERDRGLSQEICYGVIRWMSLLDYNIDKHLKQKKMKKELRTILQLSVYQLFFLDSIPGYATISIAVEMTKKILGKQVSGFTNAVLKKISESPVNYAPGESLKAKSINTSHPLWMVRRWNKEALQLQTILDWNNKLVNPWYRVNLKKIEWERVEREITVYALSKNSPVEFSKPYFAFDKHQGEFLRSHFFTEGYASVQDITSGWVIDLLDPKPGERILDACAAPGGKSAAIAERIPDNVYSADLVFNRLIKIMDVKKRLGHKNVIPLVMDVNKAGIKPCFDKILLDAPCSNMGVLNKRPEAKWRHTPSTIKESSILQKKMLRSISPYIKTGGVLVYATCSPEPEETIEVIQDFLQNHPAWILENAADWISTAMVKEKCFWVLPGVNNCDGFFAARLKHTG